MGKKNKSNLGKTLIKSTQAPRFTSVSSRHATEIHDDQSNILQSITEQSTLNDFISTAELANREFTAERMSNTTIVTSTNVPGILTDDELQAVKEYQDSNKEFLNIPRRPLWNEETTPEQLETAERESFLQWRKQLALLADKDDKIVLTPFEKNIDVWRQLWRVIERSDVVCQIVDGRNPLLFKCDDLEKYVQEVGGDKENIIIVNKADYLTDKQREYWSEYFQKRNITVIFWSALMAAIEEKAVSDVEHENMGNETDGSDDDDDDETQEKQPMDIDNTEITNETLKEERDSEMTGERSGITEGEKDDMETVVSSESSCKCNSDKVSSSKSRPHSTEAKKETQRCPVFSRKELIEYFENLKRRKCPEKDRIVIGMVGFPNVGKSSTINALLGDKKTSVSSTPGKTKHFQTINIADTICLCDCPGLVFPMFVSTKAEMILNGVLPVDQMRDYRPPMTLLCKLVPRPVLEGLYGINIPRPGEGEDPNRAPTADEFLSSYSSMRGFMTSHGMPDCSRGSRHVIKDFLSGGKLLYCEPPPEVSKADFEPAKLSEEKLKFRKTDVTRKQDPRKEMSALDKEFFDATRGGIHYNAPSGVRSLDGDKISQEKKPWKKHFNRNKKEKLRRIKNN